MKNVLILYNQHSGNGRMQRYINRLETKYTNAYTSCDVFFPKHKGQMKEHIIDCGAQYDEFVVCGGDGTFNEVLNGIMNLDKRPSITYLPTGTCNDIGRMLGINKMSLRQEIRRIDKLVDTKIDVCRANNQYFTYAGAFGKFSSVSYMASKEKKHLFGRGAYFFECLKYLRKKSNIDLEITSSDGTTIKGKYYCVLLLNTQNVAGLHFYRLFPCKINDGLIDITLINRKSHFSLFHMSMFFLLGDLWQYGVENIRGSKFNIKTAEKVKYNLDGERAFKASEAEVEIFHKAINIKMSKKSKKKYC